MTGDPRSSRSSWARSGFRSRSCRIARASSWATRSGTGVGSSCSIPGSGSATRSSTTRYQPGRQADRRRPGRSRHRDRRRDGRRQLPPPCRPCRSELARSRTCRSTSRRPNGRSRTRPTTRSSSGSTFPRAGTSSSRGDHEPFDGLRIVATPGHTPGHQSLVVETRRRSDRCSPARPSTRSRSGSGEPDELEGRSGAPDREAYDRSTERLHALEPARVHFGHDRRSWSRAAA